MRTPSDLLRPCAVVLLGALLLFSTGCGDDSPGGPTPPSSNTPPIPTVANPAEELPARSDYKVMESAMLSNFSPAVASGGRFVEALNADNVGYLFQLKPGRYRLMENGDIVDPSLVLQWRRPTTGWVDCVHEAFRPCFDFLGTYGGHYYYISSSESIFALGDLNCRIAGANLASIQDENEDDFLYGAIRDFLGGHHNVFIGLTDYFNEGSWQWRDGSPVTYLNWAPHEPNNRDGVEHFVHYYYRYPGQWNDAPGGHTGFYVMETDEPFDEEDSAVGVHRAGSLGRIYLRDLAAIEDMPWIHRRVYWHKVFQKTLGAGSTYSEEHSYEHGVEETNGMSFGWSIGISTTIDWGAVSTEIEAEFHQDFHREVTISQWETFTKEYSATAPEGKTVVFALWQLREEYVIGNANGEAWEDPNYVLADALPILDQGLDQEYIQTLHFDQTKE